MEQCSVICSIAIAVENVWQMLAWQRKNLCKQRNVLVLWVVFYVLSENGSSKRNKTSRTRSEELIIPREVTKSIWKWTKSIQWMETENGHQYRLKWNCYTGVPTIPVCQKYQVYGLNFLCWRRLLSLMKMLTYLGLSCFVLLQAYNIIIII